MGDYVDGLAVLLQPAAAGVLQSVRGAELHPVSDLHRLLLAARSKGASVPQQITRVIMLASIPTVLAGLRLGGALAIIGVVVSELHRPAHRHRPD